MNDNFYCLKLKSGETLFAEVVSIDTTSITITNPMLIKIEFNGFNESMSMLPWTPYIESSDITLSRDHIYFLEKMNKQFFEYYGEVVLQSSLNKIKQKVAEKMMNGFDFIAMSEGLEEMKQVSEKLTKKFGIASPDFSDFEEILERNKLSVVLH